MERLWQITFDPRAPEAIRVAAAVALLNRIQGLPTQMTVTAPHDELSMLTDEELVADIERRAGHVRAFVEGISAAIVSQAPPIHSMRAAATKGSKA